MIRPLLLLGLLFVRAQAAEWPAHYRVERESISPDGRYGLLVFDGRELPGEKSDVEPEVQGINYLADLKEGRLLGDIENSRYYYPHNRLWLRTKWAADSSWCLAIYDVRFGFYGVQLILPSKEGFTQIALGEEIEGLCQKVVEDATLGFAFRQIVPGQLSICVTGTTNPKELENREGRYVCFRGTFDLTKRRWKCVSVKEIQEAEYDALAQVPGDEPSGDGGRADSEWDNRLNAVYKALRVLLPVESFASLRTEQRAWLTETEKLTGVDLRNARLKSRVEELERRFWSL